MVQNLADDKNSLLSYFIITCYKKSYDIFIDGEPDEIKFKCLPTKYVCVQIQYTLFIEQITNDFLANRFLSSTIWVYVIIIIICYILDRSLIIGWVSKIF